MGRKKKNTVYRYFELIQNGTAKCLVPECGKSFKTHHGANLLKHLKYIHKDEFKTVEELNKSRDEGSTAAQTRTTSEIVIHECTNLVAVHGRPFAMMNDRAFQNLLSIIPNNNATVNAEVIKENVESQATKMKYELGNTLRDKFLSLKVDIASLATRSFMGINCQYIENGRIILRNLGMIEIFQSHTAEHLKQLLIFNLHRFCIPTGNNKQIYCITTDNGANMIKMSKLLNEDAINQSHEERGGTIDSDSENDDNMVSEDLEEPVIEIDELANVLRAEFEGPDEDYSGIGIVRCAAHTLQLALQDTGNEVTVCNLISRCREIVRRLRTPKFVRLIRENQKLVPKLDCGTRWHSKIDMVESLLPLRDICDTDSRLYLPSTTWSELEDFVKSLLPAKQLTKKLQDEQLIVGDFYIAWMMCIIELTKIATTLSSILKAKMKEREKALFENNVFLNAIFLDPRVNSILTTDQQNKAKENLKKLHMRHFETENRSEPEANSYEPFPTNEPSNSRETIEARGELEDFLNTSYINSHGDLSVLLMRREDLNQLMTSFLNEPLLKSTENVIKYWEKSRDKFPLLYKLAKIVLSAPMTQVSVERLFSSLKFVVSNYRFSLKSDVIDDLLFIRSNNIYNK